jgi:predicted nucleic acid-binding protein
LNVVDSSGWLEYFADTKRASLFAKPIEDTENLIVSVISIYEVFKKLLSGMDEDTALTAIAHMQMGTVIDLDLDLSMFAARISVENRLPMADSIIWSTALRYKATLWTQDADFSGLKGRIKYFQK